MTPQNSSIVSAVAAVASTTTALLGVAWLLADRKISRSRSKEGAASPDADSLPSVIVSVDGSNLHGNESGNVDSVDLSVLPCIRDRRSIFPSGFEKNPPPLDEAVVRSLLDAALYGPFHGKCYSGNRHPARFIVLGGESMVEMQRLTLGYYDSRWEESWSSEGEYQAFRKSTEEEITGRWGPVSYMIAIVMRRQAGPRRFPAWEEAAAVACAVQNMHIQGTKFPRLACYWSSWHDKARDSDAMKKFLEMGDEDKCMGFFIVAHAKNPDFRPRRTRDRSLMAVEWRP